MYRTSTWEAAPAAEFSQHTTLFAECPNPFLPKVDVKTVEVKVEGDPCAKCHERLGTMGTAHPVFYDVCRDHWHLKCAGLQMPPHWGSWACLRCDG